MARLANVQCKSCGETDVSRFGRRKVGNRIYPRHLCKPCHNRDRTERRLKEMNDPVSQLGLKYKERKNLRGRLRRQKDVAKAIYTDCRGSDNKFSRHNDLDLDFVRKAILNECLYCGESELRRTLDRIDNDKGHTKDNVITACVRCNYLRRDMPFEAWKVLVPTIKSIREQGLFGDWIGGIHQRFKRAVAQLG